MVLSIIFLVSLIALAQIDVIAILDEIKLISAPALLAAAAFLLAGVLLAAVRLWFISSDIGTPLTFKEALLALSVGQIVGAVSVQFFGQIAARSALLGRRGVSAPANIVMAAYERLVSVAISGLMATAGAWYLFGKLALDLEGGGAQLLKIVLGVATATVIAATAAWGGAVLRATIRGANAKNVAAIVRSACLTIAVQLTTAVAYIVIGRALSGTTPTAALFAATVVIMFAASMPISFSGWGVRELSAVLALGAIGIKAPTAVAISVVLGALALGAVIVIAGVATILTAGVKDELARTTKEAEENNIAGILKWTLPLAAATAVFFQIYVPTGATKLNVNLADPIAILSAAIFVIGIFSLGRPKWRFPWLNTAVGVATVVVVLSFLHGYYVIGWSDWAFTNRLVGWFVLLCYAATGALIAQYAGERGAQMFTRAFVASACSIVLFELVLVVIASLGVKFPEGIFALPIEGFSQNRNAFSFMLLLAICAVPMIPYHLRRLSLVVILLGLWYAGSRAGLGAFLILVFLVVYLKAMSLRDLCFAILFFAVGVLAITVIPIIYAFVMTNFGSQGGAKIALDAKIPIFIDNNVFGTSNIQRFTSITDGLRIFLDHPIFGAGLGFYIDQQVKLGTALVIHSTPVWLLAEGGIAAFAAFAVPAALIFAGDWQRRNTDAAAQAVILTLVMFAVMSSVHELLYQRAMWMLLGLCLSRFVQVPGEVPAAAPTPAPRPEH